MEPALDTLIALYRAEEKQLLGIVSDDLPVELRLIALFDLEKLRVKIHAMTEEAEL